MYEFLNRILFLNAFLNIKYFIEYHKKFIISCMLLKHNKVYKSSKLNLIFIYNFEIFMKTLLNDFILFKYYNQFISKHLYKVYLYSLIMFNL